MNTRTIRNNIVISLIATIMYMGIKITVLAYGLSYPTMTKEDELTMQDMPYKEAVVFMEKHRKIVRGFEISKMYISSTQSFIAFLKDCIPIFFTLFISLSVASKLNTKQVGS